MPLELAHRLHPPSPRKRQAVALGEAWEPRQGGFRREDVLMPDVLRSQGESHG